MLMDFYKVINLIGGTLDITFIFFTNDNLIFGEATIEGTTNVVTILQEHEQCFGQQVNFGKSLIYFSTNIAQEMCTVIENVLHVQSTMDPELIWRCL